MNKQPISVTLDPDNLLWLRTRMIASGCRSVSEVLNRLIRDARTPEHSQAKTLRSVIGTLRIAEADPDLLTADEAVRALFPHRLKGRRGLAGRNEARAKKVKQGSTLRERKHG